MTREVSPSMEACELTHFERKHIDIARARVQHAAYEACLRDLGARVIELAAEPDYPDAVFVMTHRDPVQTLASLCRLTETFRAPRMRHVDSKVVGAQMFDFVSRHIDRLMAFTGTERGRARVINVDYYRLLLVPDEVLRGVYTDLGTAMPEAAQAAVRAWQRDNPKGKRGVFKYALESFGLDTATVAKRFAPYAARFGVPGEAEGLGAGG